MKSTTVDDCGAFLWVFGVDICYIR